MSLGTTLATSFLVTLVRPATWPLALAAFLLRGGWIVVVAPVVVIPSAAGVANAVAPFLTSFVFGGVSNGLIALSAGALAACLVWLVVGGFLAAGAEAEMIAIVATDEDVVGGSRSTSAPEPQARAWRIVVVRLVALTPLVLALAVGSVRIVSTTYRELTVPSDVTLPIAWRVITAAPEAVAIIIVTWLVGQVAGAVAARRVVLAGEGVSRSLVRALGWCVRHPIRTMVLEGVPLVALIAVVIPSSAAAAAAWSAIGGALRSQAGPVPAIALLILFVGLWVGGLLLIAVTSAWRNAAWTVAMAGTFGAIEGDPQGGWQAASESGTLTDLRPRGVDPDAR
jgi:hypothetical protein